MISSLVSDKLNSFAHFSLTKVLKLMYPRSVKKNNISKVAVIAAAAAAVVVVLLLLLLSQQLKGFIVFAKLNCQLVTPR